MPKIKVNDNLTNIFNYIETQMVPFTLHDLVQYILDYDLYQEFYLNQQLIYRLYDEKIKSFENRKEEKKNETEITNLL